jgi:predicted O-methyltransferase YrrM
VNLIVEGIKYQLHAKKRQGIHSPFIYDLVDKGLTHKVSIEHKRILKAFDLTQQHDTRVIHITDLGAGSRKLSTQRTIKDIHRVSSSGKRYGRLLYLLCKHYKPLHILELGSSLGRGTLAMHLGHPEAQITTIEGSAEIAAIARENINEFATNRTNIEVISSSFSTYLSELGNASFDLVYIDGHHEGEALRNYLDQIMPYTHEQTLFLLDDIRWNDDMFKTWNELIFIEHFHVSIDFFRMGMLSQRNSQAKEHFTLSF